MAEALPQRTENSWLWRAAWTLLAASAIGGLLTIPALFMWFGDPLPGTHPHPGFLALAACLFNAVTATIYLPIWGWLVPATLVRIRRIKPLPAFGLVLLVLASPMTALAAMAASLFLIQTFT